jgi:hypothetical protein
VCRQVRNLIPEHMIPKLARTYEIDTRGFRRVLLSDARRLFEVEPRGTPFPGGTGGADSGIEEARAAG